MNMPNPIFELFGDSTDEMKYLFNKKVKKYTYKRFLKSPQVWDCSMYVYIPSLKTRLIWQLTFPKRTLIFSPFYFEFWTQHLTHTHFAFIMQILEKKVRRYFALYLLLLLCSKSFCHFIKFWIQNFYVKFETLS